jgi:uncharacterized protein
VSRIVRPVVLVALVLSVVGTSRSAPADPAGSARETGYITLPDDVLLHYSAVFPNDGKRHPTLFEYSGYNPGAVPDEPYIARYVPKGYAYIGVNLRGTGCSGGTFDFFEPQQAVDGKFVIDNFIPKRPWSNGNVAMIGKSYPGITQLFVAEQRPRHLKAIAPGHFYADAYRDVAYPGGILDYSFAAAWSFVSQPEPGYASGLQRVAGGDGVCAQNMTDHTVTNARYNPFIQAQEHPFWDPIYVERSPQTHIKDIDVPVFTALAWQDEQLGSRQSHILSQLDVPYWAILTNGDHGMYRTKTSLALLDRFYERYLKGIHNGFEKTPHVMVWWEADESARAPRWVTGFNAWPVRTTPRRLFLAPGGALAPSPPAESTPDPYVYPAGSQGIGNPRYGSPSLPNVWMWPAKPAPGTTVAYTSPPLAKTTVALGSASLDLWLASTAPDTDLQVTLTEVRPDGQEMYVQKGWLRASHRALDRKRSTTLRPFQTHLLDDFTPLTPSEPTPMRVEIFPFGHVFRAGSRIRVWIEAPTALPELWGFAFTPIPAVNLVYHDATHPSSLVLPIANVPVPARVASRPACGTIVRQPCRAA